MSSIKLADENEVSSPKKQKVEEISISSPEMLPDVKNEESLAVYNTIEKWESLMENMYSKLNKRSKQMYKEAIKRVKETCDNKLTDYRDLLMAILASETLFASFIDDPQETPDLFFEDEYYTPSNLFKYTIRDCFVNSIVPRDRRLTKSEWRFSDYGLNQNDINIFHLRYHLRNFAAHCGISKSEGALKCDICRWAIFNIDYAMNEYFCNGIDFEQGLDMTCSEFLTLLVSGRNGIKLFELIAKTDFKIFSMFNKHRRVTLQMESN